MKRVCACEYVLFSVMRTSHFNLNIVCAPLSITDKVTMKAGNGGGDCGGYLVKPVELLFRNKAQTEM